MGKRTAIWSLGIVTVAALGAVAAYSAADRAFLPGPRGAASSTSTAPAAEPVRRSSRIDGDMKATFERLEKSGAEARTVAAPNRPAMTGPQPDGKPVDDKPVRAASIPNAGETLAQPAPPAVATAPTKPAKGMPVSLVPASREAAAAAPRVMDPRLTKALDQLGAGPRATVAALPEAGAASSEAAPAPLRPPVGVVADGTAAVADKNESEMTADDLNAREHRRIRQVLEGSAGGTN